MDFGLWVEPEMVNPDSDLYRKHPDWVLNFPGRPDTEQRNQLVLNLARPDVRDYVLGFLDKLLTENDIAFLKWDYNRNWSEPGWDQVAAGGAEGSVCRVFTRNLYGILAELRSRHPKVEIESCSGGGGRVDLGILEYADEVWPSDNTDPFDRLTIQDGFTLRVYAADDDGVGDGLAALAEQALHVATLPDVEFDAGFAGHWREHREVDAGGDGDGQAADRGLHAGAGDDCAGRPVPADFAARRQRVFSNGDGESRTRASRSCSRSSIPRRRGAGFRC